MGAQQIRTVFDRRPLARGLTRSIAPAVRAPPAAANATWCRCYEAATARQSTGWSKFGHRVADVNRRENQADAHQREGDVIQANWEMRGVFWAEGPLRRASQSDKRSAPELA